MNVIAAIVQARISSTRLPGKVLEQVGGRTVLDHVLSRCAAIPGVDVVCCAIPEGPAQESVAREAMKCGAVVFAGSETDVLNRYHKAAESLGATTVIRVTSDCPLIDPAVCGDVLRLCKESAADYACNNMPPSWPHGLDCEVVTASALARADANATAAYDREHVTPWLRKSGDVSKVNLPCPVSGLAELRWTLDYPEDLAFFHGVFGKAAGAGLSSWRDVLKLVAANPELSGLNAMHQRAHAG